MTDYNKIPDELQERDQWLLWDASYETPRQPHWNGDFSISWSDPNDWHSFQEAVDASKKEESWGIGYVTAYDNKESPRGLYGVIDIDRGYIDGSLSDWVPDLDPFTDANTYMEYSPSGTGIHIPIYGSYVPDWWKDCQIDDHTGVDVLTNKFCTFTGDTLEESGSGIADIDPSGWLSKAFEEIKGEKPGLQPASTQGQYDSTKEWDEEIIEEALQHVDQDLHYNDWLRVGMAIYDWDSTARGKSIFESWSRRNAKWEKEKGQPHIDDIWSGSPDGKVTVGTLFHFAKKGGFEFPNGGPKEAEDPEFDKTVIDPISIIGQAGYDPDDSELGELKQREIAHAVSKLMPRANNYHFKWSPDKADNEPLLWGYKDGLWHQNGTSPLRIMCRNVFGPFNTQKLMNKIKHSLFGTPELRVDPDEMGSRKGTIAVENGLLELQERGLQELQPDDNAVRKLSTEYVEDADYEDTLFYEIITDNVRDETDLKRLQEYAGYTLWHQEQRYGKVLFLIGPTDSGKSLFLKILKGVLGRENVASESLHNLMETRWGIAQLYGRLANIRNEITAEALGNVERFKEMAGGGDDVTAEYKNGRKFDFTLSQKFIFATNQIPSVKHADDAFFNRMLFVKFPETIPKADQDPEAQEKILDNEKAEILNWMLDGLDRLLEQDGFTGERSVEKKKDISNSWGGVLDRFLHNVLEITGDMDDVIHKGQLYDYMDEFADWVDLENDMRQAEFTKQLKQNAGVNDGQSRRIDDPESDKPDVFVGMRLKQEAVDELEADPPNHAYSDDEDKSGQTRIT